MTKQNERKTEKMNERTNERTNESGVTEGGRGKKHWVH